MKKLIPYLANEAKASKLFLKKRWPDGKITCVYCGSENVIYKGPYQKYFSRYLCKDCSEKQKKQVTFNDKTGTIYNGPHLSMSQWIQIKFLLSLKQNTSEIAHIMELPYQRVYRAVRLIQGSICEHQEKEDKPISSDHIEADEMYVISGLKRNKEAVKRAGRSPRRRRLKKRV
jgi:transposase-like protein